jgi:hypothetical protein
MSVPAWCTWTRGKSALLLVAPHGGRRPAVDATAPPPTLRVNDLYTPELTALLAARLDAATVINREQDRNTLDLNRSSQVLRRAPWFLDLLVQQITAILTRHPVAEVLFIHGWNIGQPKCDLGVGAVETAMGLHVPDGAALTVDAAYLRQRIAALRTAATVAAIGVSLGERYPASHRNNILQLFAARAGAADNPAAQRLAAWAAAGRVNALQLELGIPLRWPGAWRDRFIGVLAASFSEHRGPAVVMSMARSLLRPGSGQGWSLRAAKSERLPARGVGEPLRTQHSGLRTDPAALQFYDPVADVGMFAGVGPMGPHVTGGRLLLFLGGQRIALFTGETVGGADVAPLAFRTDHDGTQLHFRGPILWLDDAGIYLDLEAALARSQLVDAELELSFVRRHTTGSDVQFGRVDGRLRIDGATRRVSTGAFANAGGLRASGARPRTMLAADFGDGGGLLSRSTAEAGRSIVVHFTTAGTRPLEPTQLAVSPDANVSVPRCFELRCTGQPSLQAEPRSHMAILRPTGRGSYLRVTFGVARFAWGTQTGWGLYEHAVPVVCGASPSGACDVPRAAPEGVT